MFAHGWTHTGATLNVPAVLIVGFITILLVIGIKESATFNGIIVAVKVAVILTFVGVGIAYLNPANWHPFIPEAAGPGKFGWGGVLGGWGCCSVELQAAPPPRRIGGVRVDCPL